MPQPVSPPPNKIFFRAFEHRFTCVANMQRLDEAKRQWVLDFDKQNTDVPRMNDIFGPNRYIPAELKCPGGTVRYSISGVVTLQSCPNVFYFTSHAQP